MVISALIGSALARAWSAGIAFQERAPEVRAKTEAVMRFEEKLRDLITNAFISTTATDTTTYFVGEAAEGAQANVANSLIFTIAGGKQNGAYLASRDEDFTILNEKYGPQGGPIEISISTVPVGNAPEQSGLFLREQRPGDGDPSQGGTESMIEPDLTEITFEFFDGQTWQTEWNTTSGTRRLPAAVKVTYTSPTDDESRTLVIALKNSDVTPDDPVETGDA